MSTTTAGLKVEEKLSVQLRIPELDVGIPLERTDIHTLVEKVLELDLGRSAVEQRLKELVDRFVEKGYDPAELSAIIEKHAILGPSAIDERVIVRVFPVRHPSVLLERYACGTHLEYVANYFTKERNELGNQLKQLVGPYFDLAEELRKVLEERLKREDDEEDDR
jgi:hypothetical protein